jgi:hypothetical protein
MIETRQERSLAVVGRFFGGRGILRHSGAGADCESPTP